MTIKQKFSSIDQSKLTADQKAFLTKIKDVTKNFTDAEMNKKVEAPLDGFIAKAKEKMPEAIKSAPVKRTGKAKTSQTRKPKRTAMSLAKEIRKQGETWKDAQARASKMMKEDSKDLSKTVETELDKLSKLVRSQKERSKLVGISGTNLKRDASRKAKPRGSRTVTHSGETSNQYGTFSNKLGRKYTENRDRHSDRLAPNYPKNAPYLAEGGYLTDPTFGNFQAGVYAKGGSVTNERRYVNKGEDYEVRYSKPILRRKGYQGKRDFELGGVMATDLAGHTGGGDAGLNAGMPLDGFSNTGYTGLVGETGAMSSGEMFMAGGSIDKNFNLTGFKQLRSFETLTKATYFADESRIKFPKERTVVIKNGNEYQVWGTETLSTDKTGNRVYANGGGLPSGAEQSYMITESFGTPAQHYARGGGVRQVGNREYSYGRNWTNDHRHINKAEDHEVKYTRKGKFLGIFDDGGAMTNNYESKNRDFGFKQGYYVLSNKTKLVVGGIFQTEKEAIDFANDYSMKTKDNSLSIKNNLESGDINTKYNKGGALTNERLHVNHSEDYEVRYAKPRPKRKGYKGVRKFMAGGSMETPRIYVADLEAYNNGRLVGEWLDLDDYNDADELMDAIQDVLKKSGGEEYAIHDYENFPSNLYSEYMSRNDFQALYDVMETAKRNDLPLEVVQDIVSQYGEGGVEEFQGKYDNAEDFAQQLVDDIGIESFNDYQYYLDVSETDRRLLAQEMADSYVDDIRNEDGGNRLIEEAGMDVLEYQEADNQTQEEMLDEAREIVYNEYYDNWYDGLNDPYEFLVNEQGMYSPDDFAKANFVRVDYEKLGDALEQDYTFIEYDGDLYVFNIR